MGKYVFFTLCIVFCSLGALKAQPFQPCTSAGQNSCTCATAPKICTINDLDGYNFQMSTYQHPNDGPTPMCNPMPPGSGGTTSNNPTWVAFLAWCEEFTLELAFTNCTGGNTGLDRGLQAAIYSQCVQPQNHVVDGGCATAYFPNCNCGPTNSCTPNCFGCGVNNGTRVMNISGLTVGATYYLLVDGCAGSACNVTINVVDSGGNCTQSIGSWPSPIDGPTEVCVGTTHDYTQEIAIGAIKFPWYINGVEIGGVDITPGTNTVTYPVTWTTPGTYTLCVDGYNGCVPVTAAPAPNCITVKVYDAEAGNITAQPTPVCPNGVVNINVTGSNTNTGISQYILIVDDSGEIIEVVPGTSTTFTWPTCANFTAYSYNYVTSMGTVPMVGDNISSIQSGCNTTCCELDDAPFSFADTQPPVFTTTPPNLTFNCYADVPAMPQLTFTDNCIAPSMITGVQEDNYTNCDGGTITRTWTVTDSCGNSATKVQTITIQPVPEATHPMFADTTVNCDAFPPATYMPVLNYTNGLTGPCQIAGSIVPIRTVDTMNCEGTVTYLWEYTDFCGRLIEEERVWTVNPPLEAEFISPPADVTVTCVNFPPTNSLPPLSFTNGQTGVCAVAGQIIPTREVDTLNCEGTVTFTWEGNDRCGRPLYHQQVVTVLPPPDIYFVNVPLDTATIECYQIPDPAILPPLAYTNGVPSGSCRITGTVIPERTDAYDICGGQIDFVWEKTDSCGRSIDYTQTLFVLPAPVPVWINPPANVTLPCGQTIPAGQLPPLQYSNGQSGFCSISGQAIPTRVDDVENCSGTITFTWEYTDECGRQIPAHQQVVTLSPPNLPAWVNPPADITVTCPNKPDPNVLPSLSYTNNGTGACNITGQVTATRTGELTNCEGVYTYSWTFTDFCGREINHTQNITILPPDEANFINPPADITVTCPNKPDPNVLPVLQYNNNMTGQDCAISGQVTATRTGQLTNCEGVYTYTWTFTDQCNRVKTHTQMVTILPPDEANFINPPADITVTCPNKPDPNVLPVLQYNNNMTGQDCAISGQVTATRTGDLTNCAGVYTYTWQFTDQCNRQKTHTQTVTILAPDEANFINPPADITVTCPNKPDPNVLPVLQYTNNMSGQDCAISGQVTATRTGDLTNCAGVYTYTWQFTDQCNRQKTHTQTVTIQAPDEANFINPPADITVTCPNKPDPNVLPVLQYTNNMSGQDCAIAGQVTATRTGDLTNCAGVYTYTWQFTDQCNRQKTHTQTITILAPDEANFINPPADITVTCPNKPDPNVLPVLQYTNNMSGQDCAIAGQVTATRTGDLTNCAGVYTYTWQFTDQCNRQKTHTQTVTILAPDEANFINPPANITVTCPNKPDPNVLPVLQYTNNMSGQDCAIAGQVTATRTGDLVNCAGVYTYTWQFTDQCNRQKTHTQTITILPPDIATFINPPANITVSCPDKPDPNVLPVLQYTNNMSGADCAIAGSVTATRTGDLVNCAGVYTYLWETTDQCGRPISHTQTITILPPAQPQFINPPANVTVNCTQLPDLSVLPVLQYDNGMTGDCRIFGDVTATQSGQLVNCQGVITYEWRITDPCNRELVWTQTLTVLPTPEAVWLNPPPSIVTVPCDQAPDINNLPTLSFSNGSTGACLIEGSATPTANVVENGCAKTITLNWQNTDICNRTITYQQVVNVLPPPVPTLVNPPVYNAALSCADADAFDAPDIAYTNNKPTCLLEGFITPTISRNFNACGGNLTVNWSGTDQCGNAITYSQIIVVNPAPAPSLITAVPDDITVDCQDISGFAIPLEYTNNQDKGCERSGTIAPVVTGSNSVCGGNVTITWTATDQCGFTFNESQNIQILPAPAADWINPPDPQLQANCTDIPPAPPVLSYTNGETGFCSINGSVAPVQTGSYNACGGTIQYTWQFTDACNRTIFYNQTITVLPADDPFFVTSPVDITLNCFETYPAPPNLQYTNGLAVPCAISGTVVPSVQDLGTSRIYTWTYTNACTGTTIQEDQEVSLRPVPDIVADPTNIPICYGEYFDLSEINVTDLNNNNSISLSYHFGTPANASNELSSIVINTLQYSTYYILATNDAGCTDQVQINFTNVFPPVPGVGKTVTYCNDGRTINLWNLLTPPYDNFGYWSDTYGTGINISDPKNVSLAGLEANTYQLEYIVPSGNICPDPLTTVTIILVDPGFYEILDVKCSPDFKTYTVRVNAIGYNVTASAGTVTSNGSIKTISGIPITKRVSITLKSINGDCADIVLAVDPPQCNCPTIKAPVSGGNKVACQFQQGVKLSVKVDTMLTAVWYDSLTGGKILKNKSLTFEPPTDKVGVFTYYAMALDSVTGCYSLRTPLIFEVKPNPDAKNAALFVCDDNDDGIAQFDLNSAHPDIIQGGGFTFYHYLTLLEAQKDSNRIQGNLFTNSFNGQTIYVAVMNANGCKDIAELTLNVKPLPSNLISVTAEVCDGAKNGTITVGPPTAGLDFRLNTLAWTTNPQFTGLSPATYQVQVRDANGCIKTTTATIQPGQKLAVEELTLTCNNNGTTSVGNDDTYSLKLKITSSVAGGTFRVEYKGNPLGNYSYNTTHTLTLSADGTSGTIEFIDNTTGCKVSRQIGPLDPCSTSCDIILSDVKVQCDKSGTDDNPADDIYRISFSASVLNGGTSTTFTVLVNGAIQGTYTYGSTVSFTLPADGTTPDIKIRDFLNLQCVTSLPVGALNPCSGSCSISATVTNIQCNNAGTINDPSDDTFTFTVKVTGFNLSAGWKINNAGQLYPYNTNVNLGPYLISQGNLALILTDSQDPNCKKSVNVTAPPVCSTPCILQVSNVNIGPCDNNNTGNTAADDKFTITFVVTAVSGSTSFYNVTVGNQSFGPFNYGQTATIAGLAASGQNLTLTATDANNIGCTVQFTVKQDPCSSCPQTVSAGNDFQLTCAQNVATLSGTASATGGVFVWTGPNNFNKTGQTVTTSLEGEYTLTVTFPDQCVKSDKVLVLKDANLPVANAGPDQELTCKKLIATLTGSSNLTANVIYTWTNAAGTVIGNTPSINVTAVGFYYLEVTNTLNNCKSGKDEVEVFNRNQQLTFNTKTWTCSNGGTPSNSNDDTYTIVFNLANSTGATNQYRILYQGVEIGVYNYNTNVQLSAPADGQERTYEFEDLVTGCKTTTKVGPLISCSTTCLISFEQFTSECNDNGTESDETDDTYTITFVVNALNGGGVKSFIVFIDGVDKGTFTYGSKVTFKLPANRTTPFIQLQDKNIPACVTVVPVESLIPCSSTCTMTAQVSNILCNDNGTINDPSDDKFFFDVLAEGLNTSVVWKISGDNRTFNYNERINLGPYPISGGNISLTLVDSGDSDCSVTVQVKAPSVCSEPCVLQAADIQILDCNNNNTGNTTADDYFSVKFRVNRISGSATNYTVSDGVKTYGPFIYGQLVTIDKLPANGTNIVLNVTDPTNTGCKTSFVVQKAPCSSCTQTVDAGSDKLITCQNNVATLTATSSQAGIFTWTGPVGFTATGATVQTSTPGMYYISVLYSDQCIAKDSVRVNKDANVPSASAGPDKTLNCLITSVSLIGSSSPGGNLSLVWTNASGAQVGTGSTINVTAPGVYYFEVINTTNNCSSGKDEVKVTQNTTKPDAEIVADPGNLLDCIVGTVVLSGKPIANVIFNWQTGESFINNQPSITISKEGIVTMTAIDTINGCQDIATIEIIDLQDYPILVTSPAPPITCVNNGTFLSAGNSPSGPNLVFTWLDASNKVISTVNNDSIYVVKPGTYYVILTDTLNGCSNRDTFQVNSIGDFPAVKVPEDITLYCGKTNTPISASIQNPSGAVSIKWTSATGSIQGSSTQPAINANGEGTYIVEVTYQNSGCKTTEDVKVVVDKDFPSKLLASVNNETCKDQKDGAFTITSVDKGKPPFTYTLNGKPAGAGPIFGNLSPGNYTFVVTDKNGCSFDTTFVVTPGVDISLLATSPVEILYNQQKIIEVLTNLKPSEIASVQWRPSENLSCDTCLVTLVDAKKDVTYTVVITDINGCTESINISIRVKENSIITAPNIINISGSGNKYFTIFGNESVLNILKMRIYDRWGNLVFVKTNFKPNNPTDGWDGTFNGEDVVPGVFVYVVEYETISGAKILSGDVTVIK